MRPGWFKMIFRSMLQGLMVVALSCVVSGCFFGSEPKCNKPQEYQVSSSIEPLQVPEGLDEPDRSAGLTIPELAPAAKDRQKDDPCLDSPPDYFGR